MTTASTPPDTHKPPTGATLHLGGNAYAYPDLAPLLAPVADFKVNPDNPKQGDLALITESMIHNGIYRPVYMSRVTGYPIGGNHTGQAIINLGATHLPLLWIDADEPTALRILEADNATADAGTYDVQAQINLLERVLAEQGNLLGTGRTEDYLADLAAGLDLLNSFRPTDDNGTRLDTLDPRPCPKCGYDTANDPDDLRIPR